MKKILLLVMAVIGLSACAPSTVESIVQLKGDQPSRFIEVEHSNFWVVVYDKETLTMYVVSNSGYNHGNFTLLVDADGKPLLWDGK